MLIRFPHLLIFARPGYARRRGSKTYVDGKYILHRGPSSTPTHVAYVSGFSSSERQKKILTVSGKEKLINFPAHIFALGLFKHMLAINSAVTTFSSLVWYGDTARVLIKKKDTDTFSPHSAKFAQAPNRIYDFLFNPLATPVGCVQIFLRRDGKHMAGVNNSEWRILAPRRHTYRVRLLGRFLISR